MCCRMEDLTLRLGYALGNPLQTWIDVLNYQAKVQEREPGEKAR